MNDLITEIQYVSISDNKTNWLIKTRASVQVDGTRRLQNVEHWTARAGAPMFEDKAKTSTKRFSCAGIKLYHGHSDAVCIRGTMI